MSEPIRIYGPKLSRGFRIRWACEELGLPYTCIPVDVGAGEGQSPEHKALHPLGKIPVVEFPSGFKLFESAAILTHLGDLHPESKMVPTAGTDARALYEQWMAFANTELDAHLWTRALHSFVLPSELAVPQVAPVAERLFARSRRVLAAELADRDYLLDDFSFADLMSGHILMWARSVELELGDTLEAYVARLRARPAFVAATKSP